MFVSTGNEKEEVNDNPIEQVRLTVPITDDPTQPVLTFRTWVLGILACAILSFVNQFFGSRQNQLFVGSVSVQIVVLPLGKLMAATLPTRKFKISPFSDYKLSMNRGPFNMKEHALITIFASSARGSGGCSITIFFILVLCCYFKLYMAISVFFFCENAVCHKKFKWGVYEKPKKLHDFR
ncbi:unnamed protein product [Linum tenue]|uniref:Oligopeptide transporter n=2 Tax=Linum tenue TaxID=586396 RepID=A0AAV0S056_9ROSI|nr:unnamed protein product [Linum tenue]